MICEFTKELRDSCLKAEIHGDELCDAHFIGELHSLHSVVTSLDKFLRVENFAANAASLTAKRTRSLMKQLVGFASRSMTFAEYIEEQVSELLKSKVGDKSLKEDEAHELIAAIKRDVGAT